MNLSVTQIQQLLEAGGLSWGAESVDHKAGRYWTFRCWRYDPVRFHADAKSATSLEDAARQVYEQAKAVLQ